MSAIIDGLLYSWNKNLEYGPKLVADLSEEQMTLQPVPDGKPASNHPAWVFSHLNVYIPIIGSLIEGKEFEDPKPHRFGMLSKPESGSGIYAPKQQLVDEFIEGHKRIASLLKEKGSDCLDQDVKLERWKPVMPKVAIALPYLMLVHENNHMGQISAWRRIQGMPSV